MYVLLLVLFFFFQAEDGIRDLVRSRGLGDVYKRQLQRSWMHADAMLSSLQMSGATRWRTSNCSPITRPVSYTHLTLPTIYSV